MNATFIFCFGCLCYFICSAYGKRGAYLMLILTYPLYCVSMWSFTAIVALLFFLAFVVLFLAFTKDLGLPGAFVFTALMSPVFFCFAFFFANVLDFLWM